MGDSAPAELPAIDIVRELGSIAQSLEEAGWTRVIPGKYVHQQPGAEHPVAVVLNYVANEATVQIEMAIGTVRYRGRNPADFWKLWQHIPPLAYATVLR